MNELEQYDLYRDGLPNVGQFGWTDNDLKSVKDLMMWVIEAQRAATSANTNAEYCGILSSNISGIEDTINSKLDIADEKIEQSNFVLQESNKLLGDLQVRLDLVDEKYNSIVNLTNDFNVKYNDFITKYNDFIDKWESLPKLG